MTLIKFMARSTWVACASELGKLLKCHLKEKANRKLANGQNIEDSEKRKWPKGLSAPALELKTIIFKHVYWYMQLISGERLQDHWSSGIFSIQLCYIVLYIDPTLWVHKGQGALAVLHVKLSKSGEHLQDHWSSCLSKGMDSIV